MSGAAPTKIDGIFYLRADDLCDDLRATGAGPQPAPAPAGRVRVQHRDSEHALPDDTLCVIRSSTATSCAAPLTIDVQLQRLGGPSAEVWYARGPARTAREGGVRYAHDLELLIGVVEEDERAYGGIRSAAEALYSTIRKFQEQCGFPYVLRMWNCLDAVNEGAGDAERYRQFCIGRALGLGRLSDERMPAATAIGRQQPTHQLQIYWVAARTSGIAIENPRQVSAYRYPRTHGPMSPTFSRAMIAPDGTLLVSGTASIVGHVSQHAGDPRAQLAETLRNLASVTAHSGVTRGPARPSLLKVYVRDPAHLPMIAEQLQAAYPGSSPIFLAADICRRELLLEIECIAS